MFASLSQPARSAIVLFAGALQRRPERVIGVQHLLEAMAFADPRIAQAYQAVGADLALQAPAVAQESDPANAFEDVRFSSDAKQALLRSWALAQASGQSVIEARHVALAVLEHPEAARWVGSSRVSVTELERRLRALRTC